MRNGKTQLAAIILAAVIAFGFGLGGGIAGTLLVERGYINLPPAKAEAPAQQEQHAKESAPAAAEQQKIVVVGENTTIAESIADRVLPSVVGISIVSEVTSSGFGGLEDMFGFGWGFGGGGGQTYESTSIGTGVVVDKAGYVLTNSHVVNDGDAKSITVSFNDGSEVEGTILWNDATLDLAVVKIEKDGLTAAEMGDSDELKIGSYAAAIGNPLGLEFERSMSQGIISGLDRSITVGSSSSSNTMEGLLQTDATINAGNSGGPLLNSRGQVIGINTAKASSGEGMGFAIPINVAKPIVEQIMKTGKFVRPYIGISGGALEESSYSSEMLKERFGTDKGIYIYKVTAGGGAEEAGIKEHDIITELNGIPVNTMNKLNSLLVKYNPGDKVTLTVLRNGETLSIEVKLTDGVFMKFQQK